MIKTKNPDSPVSGDDQGDRANTDNRDVLVNRKDFPRTADRIEFALQKQMCVAYNEIAVYYKKHEDEVENLHSIFAEDDEESRQLLLLTIYIFALDNWRNPVCKLLAHEEGVTGTGYTEPEFYEKNELRIAAALCFNVTFRTKTSNLYHLLFATKLREVLKNRPLYTEKPGETGKNRPLHTKKTEETRIILLFFGDGSAVRGQLSIAAAGHGPIEIPEDSISVKDERIKEALGNCTGGIVTDEGKMSIFFDGTAPENTDLGLWLYAAHGDEKKPFHLVALEEKRKGVLYAELENFDKKLFISSTTYIIVEL